MAASKTHCSRFDCRATRRGTIAPKGGFVFTLRQRKLPCGAPEARGREQRPRFREALTLALPGEKCFILRLNLLASVDGHSLLNDRRTRIRWQQHPGVPMGNLTYSTAGTKIEFDDRTLSHIQVVIAAKVRRGESFMFGWVEAAGSGGGRSAVWIQQSIPMLFHFTSSARHQINGAWIEELMLTANSPSGMRLMPEPGAPGVTIASAPDVASRSKAAARGGLRAPVSRVRVAHPVG